MITKFKATFIVIMLFIGSLLFSGCSDVKFADQTPVPSKALDVDADGINNAQDDDVDGDGIKNEDDEDCDGDGIENDEDDSPEGEVEEEIQDDETCIGNGIKVPDSEIVKCDTGEDDRCVKVCSDNNSLVVSFHEARGLIKSGAKAGGCTP